MSHESQHWYYYDGRPCYELPLAKDPSRLRSPTVRDAKKLGLVGSVSNVMGVVANVGLQRWKRGQLVKAVCKMLQMGLDPLDPENDANLWELETEESSRAAHIGTMHHDMIEAYVRCATDGNSLPDRPEEVPAQTLIAFTMWYVDMGLRCAEMEKSCASNALGYGGRIDWIGRMGRSANYYRLENAGK